MFYLVVKISSNKVEQQDSSTSRSEAAKLGTQMVRHELGMTEVEQSKIQDMLYNNGFARGTGWAIQLLWIK